MKKNKYMDSNNSFSERADDLIKRMTRTEKLSQLIHESPAIPRFGIKKYNWWNECLHGLARAGVATVFPQAIGLASAFDKKLMKSVGNIISDEARANYHLHLTDEGSEQYFGLTFWTPNINIFRDPRWGRGQETYGECPYLTSELAVSFIKALQGSDKKYLKTAACAKHFAVHSGPEPDRHHFDAKVSKKDLYETYLPAFEACVKRAEVESVMSAYNRVNGEAASASKTLLVDILRNEWRFKGHVVSDCGAIDDIYLTHKVAEDFEDAMAKAMISGCDLNCCNDICSGIRPKVLKMDAKALVPEEIINRNLKRLLMTRFKLGMFDPPSKVRYSKIKSSVIDCEKHKKAALKVSRDSLILLSNNGVLPLSKRNVKQVAVIGPNSDDVEVLLGNYSGTPSAPVTPLNGIMNRVSCIVHAKGCNINDYDRSGFQEAVTLAEDSDVVIMCMGLSPKIEGEECDTGGFERNDLGLPGVQQQLVDKIKKTGKKVILVILGGSAVSVAPGCADAIIQAWYPGQSGGTAIADLIFGKYSPSGRLPVTVYYSVKDLPDFKDYSMKNRMYRNFRGKVLYPFGYGLSYAKFVYDKVKTQKLKHKIIISVDVKNTGKMAGKEVVQLYLKLPGGPKKQLAGFEKINLKPTEKKKVSFTLKPSDLTVVSTNGKRRKAKGVIKAWVGGIQPGYEKISNSTEIKKIELIV